MRKLYRMGLHSIGSMEEKERLMRRKMQLITVRTDSDIGTYVVYGLIANI